MTVGRMRPRAPQVRKTYEELGNIMLTEAGEPACLAGYKTNDPEWVGALALQFGDINADGTLN